MPKYEYACKSCGEHIEVVQSFKDDALTECPACAGPLRKVFGSVGIVLKGPGFYRNDHRTPPRQEGSKLAVQDKDKQGKDKKDKESDAPAAGASGGSDAKGAPAATDSGTSKPAAHTGGGPKDAAKTA